MKSKIANSIIFAALIIIFLCMGQASATVVGSRHDFSAGGGPTFTSDETEVCIFCHTPHNANTDGQFLWNRTLDNTGYTPYTSSTLDAGPLSAPSGVSLLCMSCHDGVSAINVLVNYGRVNPITMDGPNTIGGVGSYPPSRDPNLTKDLSNDHPVSFIYDSILANDDGALVNPGVGGANIAPLPLYGSGKNLLECATCHDPHDDGKPDRQPFLRMNNNASAMCLKCHIK